MKEQFLSRAACALGAIAAIAALAKAKARLELSRAKHPSLAGHPRIASRIAALMPSYDLDEHEFFCCDKAPDDTPVVAGKASSTWRSSIENASPRPAS
jgi:hypothetical protein